MPSLFMCLFWIMISFGAEIDIRDAPGVPVSASALAILARMLTAGQAETVPSNLNRIMPA